MYYKIQNFFVADGNPLLGTGYETPPNATPSGSSGRIPPGGYSKGLW